MKKILLAAALSGCLMSTACAGSGVSDTVPQSTSGAIATVQTSGSGKESTGSSKAVTDTSTAAMDMQHAVTSYYEGQSSRAYKMLQKSIFKNLIGGWTEEGISNPVWNYDSFARYEVLNRDLTGVEKDAELYYCTFSADNGKCGYGVLAYHGEGMSRVKVVETSYLYDLQANMEAISDALGKTELDPATARAVRVEVNGADAGEAEEAIRISDDKGHDYLYYFSDSSLKPAEAIRTGAVSEGEKAVEGQEQGNKKQSYYNEFESKSKGDAYLLKGIIHQNQDKRGLVRVKAPKGTEISVKGSMVRESGEIKLVYRDSDGTITVLAEGKGDGTGEHAIDMTVKVKDGKGDFYFEGDAAVYQFELSLGLNKEIKYYLTGNNPIQ